ncbi:hypothetical protein ASPWEDRAFT_28308 [Aspergillus wentii DTO 134E9]|uniref:Ketoreductase domain-containing protein n=1 Tax=Aspergillus wentii DTO 134E9 TaxID=1073089 RepID=A0A1L9RLH1_ASPWE|nr:uncharacterized protein ASPWEDRAFT_28308 [Aspergillus wentii DTO 134E9]KAI9924544.1 hypothetical protein MW887_006816 [Aspergillus wentii]OJJ35688.1 hypothetical protein ASPWEDRAFT_28308 [Aspergillus wentii DTO 134E9]
MGIPSHLPDTRANLFGKTAIVTGGSRGIGAGIALELANRGAKVVIIYTSSKSEDTANSLIKRINTLGNGAAAMKIKADLCEASAPRHIVQEALPFVNGKIDIVVNNAGVNCMKSITEITPEVYASVFDLHVRAPILMMTEVLPYLRSPGRIVNMSSIAGRGIFQELSLYCSSKAALEGLTRAWATELGPKGHTVNAVSPGLIQTDMLSGLAEDYFDAAKAQTPMGNRIGTVDDVAQIVAWLASEESRWVTGQVLSASGGCAMY